MNTLKVNHPGTSQAIEVEIKQGTLRYKDSKQPLFTGLNISIPAGTWTCILGKSGCGKTSILRLLAGLLTEKADWEGVLRTSPEKKLSDEIAYMAQQDLLLPWLDVFDNVCLSFRFAGRTLSKTAKRKASYLIEQVGLKEQVHLLPAQLSGGMRQRVALARTLMQDKPLVLMDEPFSALDAVTRHQLQDLSAHLLKGKTVVLITHDPQEALRLGGNIYLMRGTPTRCGAFPTPNTPAPRKLDSELALLQQKITDQLGEANV